MGRPVMFSNGSLMVGLNEHGLVQDFYYPYVGLDNLTTSRSIHHKIGVWVEGTFSWVDDGGWDIAVDFEDDALISKVRMSHTVLGITLELHDFVDSHHNAFCRSVTVTNNMHAARDIRIFMHQVFQISRAGRADTALFEPDENYLLDYKGRCCLLIYGQHADTKPFDQFAVGNYGIEGKEGTFKDAEDGELSDNAVEHGGVDSVIRFTTPLQAETSTTLDYWIIAADSQYTAERIHHRFKKDSLAKRQETTRKHWHDWLAISKEHADNIDELYRPITKKSLMIIKAHIDKHGGILASGDSSIYNYGRDYYSYVWPRDGAYAIWPLIRMGYTEEAKAFFEFCRDIITHEGYLMHKYQPDRSIGSTWHPLLHGKRKELAIQEDETAIVIYMLGEYYRHTNDQEFVGKLYDKLIRPAANFLTEFIDPQTNLPHASYDLWEEKFLTTTYTTSVVYQALLVAAQLAESFGHYEDNQRWEKAASNLLEPGKQLLSGEGYYAKGYLLQEDGTLQYDNTLDISSLYGVMMFGYHSQNYEPLLTTAAKVEEILLTASPSGGVPRYNNDHYFESQPPHLGNPWFVATLWLAQYYLRRGNVEQARQLVSWTLHHSYPSGVLSEQVNPNDGSPVSVAPLVWSHAELVNTVLDLSVATTP